LAQQADDAGEQAGQAGQSASEMGREAAQKSETVGPGEEGETGKWNWDEGKKTGAKLEPGKEKQAQAVGKPEEREGPEQAETGSRAKDSEQAGKSSWDIKDDTTDDDAAAAEPLKGLNSLAQEAKNENQADAMEFDLLKYLEEETAGPTDEEASPRTNEQFQEHDAKMAKLREKLFFKKHKFKLEDHQGYQIRTQRLKAYILNVTKELKSMLIPGSGSDFLRDRSHGEIDDDKLAEIPAGRLKIMKQPQKPKKKKAIACLAVDVSGSMDPDSNEKYEESKRALADDATQVFQESLKEFENSSRVDLQFEEFGYNANPYIPLKDYRERLTLKQGFEVIHKLQTITQGKGGTSDYEALSLAVQRMRKTKLGQDPEAIKIIFNITDGNAGSNGKLIQELYAQNPDIRFMSFGIDKNEETARAIALSYGQDYGVAVSDFSQGPRAVMRQLKKVLNKPVPRNPVRTIVNSAMLFGFSSLAVLALQTAGGLIKYMQDMDLSKVPREEPVYEGSKFLVVREKGKEYLVYRDPETEEELIRVERGSRKNKLVPQIAWNPEFENEQNIDTLLNMFQILFAREDDHLMRNLLLSGEAGTGKNVMIDYAARLANKNVRFKSIHKRTDKNDLIKRRTFGEEQDQAGRYLRKTGWANSELVEAALNGDWIVLDEINKAEADNLGILNDMLAKGRFIDKSGKPRKVHKDFRVIATANPPGGIYAVNELSGEFIERMGGVLELDYLKEAEEIKLLQSWAPGVPREKIELLVKAGWNLRARYFGYTNRANMLAQDEVPAEKGTYMKRPISTAELRKIVEHFDKYPEDMENRAWSVINRHFSLANEDPSEVEEMKEEIRSEFEGLGFKDSIAVEDVVIQKENNKIEVETDQATSIKTRFWKIKPDKGGEEVVLKLIDEGPAHKHEEPDKVIAEVQRNLVSIYDMVKDISLGNHLLFTGHAGTGKNYMADFISYMMAGGAYLYLISMNKLIEPGDLTAWRGFAELSDEEKTEWIESFVVKAMREGRPVIIDEVNKADPGVVAILNSLLQTNTLTLPSGEVVEAKPGFCIIATMNPPISGLYQGVEALSGEFIRRFSIHESDYLPFDQELEILNQGIGKNKVNEKYIIRLLRAVTRLRAEYIEKGAIARPPSIRPLEQTIARIRDYGDRLIGGKEKRKDEEIFEKFKIAFHLERREHQQVVRDVFKETDIALLPSGKIETDTPDAIDELLEGDPLVLRGGVETEPDTGDPDTNNILRLLQINQDAAGADKNIKALAGLIEERISEGDTTGFPRRIESALYFGRIMQISLVIRGMAHTQENLKALEELEQRMEKHLLAWHWPVTFFTENPEIDITLLEVNPSTQDAKVNEILGLLQIFFADEDYRKDLLKTLRNDYVAAKFKDINQGRLGQ
ncbi:AAA family ATPase, partial [bacterium]|nr:AAA family ATPase [bacterium]